MAASPLLPLGRNRWPSQPLPGPGVPGSARLCRFEAPLAALRFPVSQGRPVRSSRGGGRPERAVGGRASRGFSVWAGPGRAGSEGPPAVGSAGAELAAPRCFVSVLIGRAPGEVLGDFVAIGDVIRDPALV